MNWVSILFSFILACAAGGIWALAEYLHCKRLQRAAESSLARTKLLELSVELEEKIKDLDLRRNLLPFLFLHSISGISLQSNLMNFWQFVRFLMLGKANYRNNEKFMEELHGSLKRIPGATNLEARFAELYLFYFGRRHPIYFRLMSLKNSYMYATIKKEKRQELSLKMIEKDHVFHPELLAAAA